MLLAAMMAFTIINVYIGKALDLHTDRILSWHECAASGSDATLEEYCLICHFHLAACTEAEEFETLFVAEFHERPYATFLCSGSASLLPGYGLRAPPVIG